MSNLNFLRNALQQQQESHGTISTSNLQSKPNPNMSLSIQELTLIAQSEKLAQQQNNPNWINKNNNRSIPGYLIKRSSLKLNKNQTEEDDLDSFAMSLSNQANKKILSSFRKQQPTHDETYQNDFAMGSQDMELPPKKSIYDLNFDDDDLSVTSEVSKRNTNDLINKDPMNFKNAFNSNLRTGLTTNASIAPLELTSVGSDSKTSGIFGTSFMKPESSSTKTAPPSQFSTPAAPKLNREISQQAPVESAVLVFGYEDSAFGEVLQHFSKFGNILEEFNSPMNFEVSSTSSPFRQQRKTYPIFIGESWVKFTYDNTASAVRLCRENETNVGDRPINIIPYSREVLEKFLNKEISPKDDIGDSLNNLNFIKLNKVPGNFETLLQGTPIMDPSKRKKEMLFNTSIKIKNGDNLFIDLPKKQLTKETKKGNDYLSKVGDLLFGFNEI